MTMFRKFAAALFGAPEPTCKACGALFPLQGDFCAECWQRGYLPAEWRSITPLDVAADRIGICLRVAHGPLRVAISGRDARKLAHALLVHLDVADTSAIENEAWSALARSATQHLASHVPPRGADSDRFN